MTMRQISEAGRRSRGRPPVRPDDQTRRLIIEAAAAEFPANGFGGTSMAAVAQRAGVSTKTLYRLIPTKADLFRLMVSDRISQFMLAVDADALDMLPLADALERMLVAYGSLTLSRQTTDVVRLVLGECDRFPELAATFDEIAIRQTRDAMATWLRRQCARGLIVLDDPEEAAGMLRGMMIMEPQRTMMLGRRAAPGPVEIAARARGCARLFLGGCQIAARSSRPTGEDVSD